MQRTQFEVTKAQNFEKSKNNVITYLSAENETGNILP